MVTVSLFYLEHSNFRALLLLVRRSVTRRDGD